MKSMPMWVFYTILGVLFITVVAIGYYISNQYPIEDANLTSSEEQQTISSKNVIENPEATVSLTKNLDAISPASETSDLIIGDLQTADVTIIEYMDLNCSHCKNFHKSLQEVSEEFGDQLALVVRHYPVLNSTERAVWMECVGENNGEEAKSEFMDRYFSTVTSTDLAYDDELFKTWLDQHKYSDLECDRDKLRQKVISQFNEGKTIGVVATPTSVFMTKSGEKDISMGAMSTEDLKQVINSYLPN